jgi:hypothetical protein
VYACCRAIRIYDDGVDKLVAVPVAPRGYLSVDLVETEASGIDEPFILEALFSDTKESIGAR